MKQKEIIEKVVKINISGDGTKYWTDDGTYKAINNDNGNAISINNIIVDDTTRADGRVLIYSNTDNKYEHMQINVSGIISSTGNIITPSGSPMVLTSGQEGIFAHQSASDDKIMINIQEIISGSTVTDTHVDFSDNTKYILQDNEALLFENNKASLNMNSIVPVMTGYTTNGVTISSNSEYSDTYNAWKAFDGILESAGSTCWASTSSVCWLEVDFGTTEKVATYTIKARPIAPDCSPKTWTFEGSNDNLTWDILDTRINEINWVVNEKRIYSTSNIASYRYYRINFTENNGNATGIGIDVVELLPSIKDTPLYFKTTNLSNYNLSTMEIISSLNSTITMPTNTNLKCLFSVDNQVNWLYKDGTGIHIYNGDLLVDWTSSNQWSEISTYFTNLSIEQLTLDLTSLGIIPINLDFAFQLNTTDNTVTPIIEKITLVYLTPQHTEFASYGSYDENTVRFGVKRINNTTLGVKNLSTSTRKVNVNVLLGS